MFCHAFSKLSAVNANDTTPFMPQFQMSILICFLFCFLFYYAAIYIPFFSQISLIFWFFLISQLNSVLLQHPMATPSKRRVITLDLKKQIIEAAETTKMKGLVEQFDIPRQTISDISSKVLQRFADTNQDVDPAVQLLCNKVDDFLAKQRLKKMKHTNLTDYFRRTGWVMTGCILLLEIFAE